MLDVNALAAIHFMEHRRRQAKKYPEYAPDLEATPAQRFSAIRTLVRWIADSLSPPAKAVPGSCCDSR